MEHGVTKWFDARKGYGFIKGENGEDIFVHFTDIHMPGRRYLRENQEVLFEVEISERGKKAKNVVPMFEHKKRQGKSINRRRPINNPAGRIASNTAVT